MRMILIPAMVLASTPAAAQITVGAGNAAPPAAPSVAPRPAPTTCSILTSTYEGASMDLAANQAAGVGDNSAPRATLRAMEDANTLAEARIALDLMRDHKCALPKSAPAAIYYLSAALACAADRMKATVATSPESCKRENWKRMGN